MAHKNPFMGSKMPHGPVSSLKSLASEVTRRNSVDPAMGRPTVRVKSMSPNNGARMSMRRNPSVVMHDAYRRETGYPGGGPILYTR